MYVALENVLNIRSTYSFTAANEPVTSNHLMARKYRFISKQMWQV